MDLSGSARNNRQITVSRAATSACFCLRSLAAPSAGGGKRLIFKGAAAFEMTQNSVLSDAPAVRSKPLWAVGGSGGGGEQGRRRRLLAPPRRDFHYSLFHFPPSGLSETGFKRSPEQQPVP